MITKRYTASTWMIKRVGEIIIRDNYVTVSSGDKMISGQKIPSLIPTMITPIGRFEVRMAM
ncbi:hypothetical protein O9929_27035 [Vibrio lentus]|nr:hypothetical protein [Vibrio lentus]